MFAGRSLCVVDDFSIEERKYLFTLTRELKAAAASGSQEALRAFRIEDADFGVYEVFLEDSTRTRESFRNAAKFHHVKVSDLSVDRSSFNKGESCADTFNTIAGYDNRVFIVRSRVEGLCRWLEENCGLFARRHGLPPPAFINAGDGKHEHPTQELLDEFTFLEDNDWDDSRIHLALIGDLFHGRTTHSKADGLKIFARARVDLVAPPELAMPADYAERMRDNGFDVRVFASIDEYLEHGDVADKWYFTRPQLERMGEAILRRQDELRAKVTFRREFLKQFPDFRLADGRALRFYHPLPRHKVHPVIPTFLDDTPLNGWEEQSINGMYVRIVLLALLAGKFDSGAPEAKANSGAASAGEAPFIVEVPSRGEGGKNYSEGVRPIRDGIVIDHICVGDNPADIREHCRLISRVLGLDSAKGGDWVSQGSDGRYKGIIFRPGSRALAPSDLKRLAAMAPGCTLNLIAAGEVAHKYRVSLPPAIYNFAETACANEECISNPAQNEGVPARFVAVSGEGEEGVYECAYCGRRHAFKQIWRR